MTNDFDGISKYYDRIKKIVFGDELATASAFFLKDIPDGSHVLILGGGSGQDLEVLGRVEVDYVEKSQRMLALAGTRNTLASIKFIHDDFMNWENDGQYDYILCPFFLDVFDEDGLVAAIVKLSSLLGSEGRLIVTDFQKPRRILQKLVLWMMHRFFGAVSSLQSNKLQPIIKVLEDQGFSVVEKVELARGFVFSCKLRRAK